MSIAAQCLIWEQFLLIGLSNSDLEYLADPATSVIKTSRRDFPGVLSSVSPGRAVWQGSGGGGGGGGGIRVGGGGCGKESFCPMC